MDVLFTIAVIWTAASVVLGIIIGVCIKWASGPDASPQDLSDVQPGQVIPFRRLPRRCPRVLGSVR